jgi:hypothetical protein
MTEQPTATPKAITEIQADLHELAQCLREARHLEPETQQTLADLLDELRSELHPAAFNSVHAAHLADIVTQLARALHEQHDAGPLAALRNRLDDALGRAEVEAPVIAGVVRRFVDALASMGI